MKKLLAISICALWMLVGVGASAQTLEPRESSSHGVNNRDLDLLRQDLRVKRKATLITTNLKLTQAEAAGSGPCMSSTSRNWLRSTTRNSL